MHVADIMTRDPVTVAVEDRVATAVERMRDRQIRHLPVMDGGALVGILSDRDLRWLLGQHLHGGSREAAPLMADRVGEVMTANPRAIHQQAPVRMAVDLMLAHRIGGLPVLSETNALVGMVTYVDVLRACRDLLPLP